MADKQKRSIQSKKTSNATTTALVLGAQEDALSKQDEVVLSEALRRAEETRNVVEDALVNLGGWLLVHVFHDDARAALEGKRVNPVWRALLERAGGPSLRLSRRFLYVAVAIAAHDKRIQDESWRLLEPGRKELLLPLGDETAMRKAAQHVVAMKLSQRATRAFVRSQLSAQGKAAKPRVTGDGFRARLLKFRTEIAAPELTRKLGRLLPTLSHEEKTALQKELAALQTWAAKIQSALGQKGE
ncbi:MAG TPA: hypothetical protein PK156_20400 [Polyangium sp.]|nr:hypothetical protein [Polyangium sp.]